MRIFESYKSLPDDAIDAVVAIGNFDGVHKGHQALLREARRIAEERQRPLAILTFEPHPRSLFRADDPPFRITPAAIKNERLAACGVDILYQIPFDWDFASQSADAFTRNVLLDGLRPAHIVVGYDFRFGQLRKGTPETLDDAGFPVTTVDAVVGDGQEAYSSSSIRTALRHAKIGEANAMLGWEWEIEGIVVEGDKRGRELGFPTANIPLGDTLHPGYGVYAAWIKTEENETLLPSATNIGIRPMFEVPTAQVEAHILDFNQEIYGQTLRIRPVKRLRGEAKFDSVEALIEQMKQDCAEARKILL